MSFFCVEDCRDPDCRGCDPNKVSLEILEAWIEASEQQLKKLYRIYEERK